MDFEAPEALLARLKLGREEYCQRLLTSLILHGPYPRWNTRSVPGPAGLKFLRTVYECSFASPWPGDDAVFVDEFELPPRTDSERGGAPDYAVLWPDRLWLIELKTEKASHRHGQIPGYFELAHHHHPDVAVDLLYVTPPMSAPYDPTATWGRYAHTTWADLVEPIRGCWPEGSAPGQQDVIDGLLAGIASLDTKPEAWRAALVGALSPPAEDRAASIPDTAVAEPDALDVALHAARLTALDGAQRGVEVPIGDLEDLLGLRLALREALAGSDPDSPLRLVMPWIWRWESTGAPLTDTGRDHGMELRVSRYRATRY